MAELRPKMQKLRGGSGDKVDWESKREERRAYIESGVRRVVGKGTSGGEEVGGEKRGRGEVEALEDVVRDLGGDSMEE